jgi:hypothetical protein
MPIIFVAVSDPMGTGSCRASRTALWLGYLPRSPRAPNNTYDYPSAFNASFTFGRAFMRSMKALTFGKGERSNSTRGAHRVTV